MQKTQNYQLVFIDRILIKVRELKRGSHVLNGKKHLSGKPDGCFFLQKLLWKKKYVKKICVVLELTSRTNFVHNLELPHKWQFFFCKICQAMNKSGKIITGNILFLKNRWKKNAY